MRPAIVALLVVTGGCSSTASHPMPAPPPAPIMHLVYVSLVNPADSAALIGDCDAMLAAIPSVDSYFCGRHLETGRANVEHGYDVALGLGFADEKAYRLYLDDPRHMALLEKWKPKCRSIWIHDVLDNQDGGAGANRG